MRQKVNYEQKYRAKRKKQLKMTAKNRHCEDCAACCFTMVVEDLGKEQYSDCKFCKGAGAIDCTNRGVIGRCKIYLNRPDACEKFSCMYLQGYLPQECRPDKLGVLLYIDDGSRLKYGVIIVNEVEEYALEKEEIELLLNKISQVEIVYVFSRDGKRKILCPESKRSEVDELIQARSRR